MVVGWIWSVKPTKWTCKVLLTRPIKRDEIANWGERVIDFETPSLVSQQPDLSHAVILRGMYCVSEYGLNVSILRGADYEDLV